MRSDHRTPKDRAGAHLVMAIALCGAILAIAVRWYFVTHVQVIQPLDQPGDWGDAAEYYRYAWNIVHHALFSQDLAGTPHPLADSYRDPGYPLFLALVMSFTHSYESWYGTVLLAQCVLGGITVASLVLALRGAFPAWLLGVVALGAALWPHAISITTYVLTENLAAPLWAIAVLCLREAVSRRSLTFTVVAAVALASASLTNAVLAPMVIPLACVFAWRNVMPARRMVILVVLALIPVAAWGFRNASIQAGQSSSFRAQINLVQGSWPTYHLATQLNARRVPEGVQTVNAINAEILAMNADPAAGLEMMWRRMSRAPGTYIMWYLSKPALLWGWQIGLGSGDIYIYPTRNSPFINQPVWRMGEALAFALNYVLAGLASIGVVLAFVQRKPDPTVVVLAVTLVWVTMVYGVLQSDARYSIPFRGGEIALAGLSVVAASRWRRRGGAIGDRAHKIEEAHRQ